MSLALSPSIFFLSCCSTRKWQKSKNFSDSLHWSKELCIIPALKLNPQSATSEGKWRLCEHSLLHELISMFLLFVLLFFFLNLGAIMALEICVCMCVSVMALYKRDSSLLVFVRRESESSASSLTFNLMSYVSESLGSLACRQWEIKCLFMQMFFVVFLSFVFFVSFLGVGKGIGFLLNVPCCILLYFSCQ